MSEIQERALDAVDEYTSACTVIINSKRPEVPHGSGVAVIYRDAQYILTAAHVLNEEPDDQSIRVIGRADGSLQMLRGKTELFEAIARGTHKPDFSSATSINITGRLAHKSDDIAALKVENLLSHLPHTRLHDLSAQPQTKVVIDEAVSIFGFPGELTKAYEKVTTHQRGLAAFPHITIQQIKDIATAPVKLDPNKDLITDFDYPGDTCDPHGLSGCGVWRFPNCDKGKVWSADKSQLLGIEVGYYQKSNLLRFVRIERVLQLLDTGK